MSLKGTSEMHQERQERAESADRSRSARVAYAVVAVLFVITAIVSLVIPTHYYTDALGYLCLAGAWALMFAEAKSWRSVLQWALVIVGLALLFLGRYRL
jgi:hypothetical protein